MKKHFNFFINSPDFKFFKESINAFSSAFLTFFAVNSRIKTSLILGHRTYKILSLS